MECRMGEVIVGSGPNPARTALPGSPRRKDDAVPSECPPCVGGSNSSTDWGSGS